MKSSFAQTFADIAENRKSLDRVFAGRAAERQVRDETGADLPAQSVLVVRSYDETLVHNEKTSTLLVDHKLREEYEKIHVELDQIKVQFINAVASQSKTKKNAESEIVATFAPEDGSLWGALSLAQEAVNEQLEAPFAEVPYDVIFDEKVLAFLKTKDFSTAVADYVGRYNALLGQSIFFKKGFEYYNATAIAKDLEDNGFFSAKHALVLNGTGKLEVTSRDQLEELVEKEKAGISSDKVLQKKFAELEKLINKNVNLRDFKRYIAENEAILTRLSDVANLRKEIWQSYFFAHREVFNSLIAKHASISKRVAEIEDAARVQKTQWEEVVDIFNRRFSVPFELEAVNRTSVILGKDSLLSLVFKFRDGTDTAPIHKSALLQVLSTGEKKALYLLNVIFEIEARRRAKQATLFVVDDVADSFDYKNKYAIIEYLKEISEENGFRQIILTHNFDFFRTLEGRFVSYASCFVASKSGEGVSLVRASGIKNVFVRDWKPSFFKDERKRIACVPFMRNIIEYTKGESDPGYVMLTSLLHWRPNSLQCDGKMLQDLYCDLFATNPPAPGGDERVVDSILSAAKGCLAAPEAANFEHKIVLSIAIRLMAERFMVEKIADEEFWKGIGANQTAALCKRARQLPLGADTHEVLQRVMLMTPENIHLNSFMYEPILDMSDTHLRELFSSVQALV